MGTKRWMLVKPVGYNLRDYAEYGRAVDPRSWAMALWYRWLAYKVKRNLYYMPMLLLYKLGLAWWPEGARVNWRDIGKRAPNSHEHAVWCERRWL